MFLDFIDKGKELPNKIDLYIAQNVILIAEALKMRSLQRKFLMEILMPMLNRENIIFYLKMAYNKLSASKQDDNMLLDDLQSQTSHNEEEEVWFDFFSYALDMAAQYIQFLIKKKASELHDVLEPSIIEEIIERAIRFYYADLQYDNSLLFETLMRVRKCDSIFQLLEQERIKIVEQEESLIFSQDSIRPTLTWRIQNLSGNFYKESDPFLVETAQWKLSVSYFKMEEEALSVQIKMVNNPFEVKKSKDYFKKKEFFLASNVAGVSNNPNPLEEAYDDENMTQEELMRRKKQIEQANAEYPSHAFITIVSSVRINQAERMSNPLVNTLICSAKTPALLKKFTDFKIEDMQNGSITVEIYFKMKYIYSAILLYISRNFTYLITDPMISLLPKDQYKLLLKHKLLNVTQEDEVVKSLCMWAEGQENRAHLDLDLMELLENVNWNYVSLQCLLDLMRNFSYIRRNPTFKKTIMKEFAMRNKFNPESTQLDGPRFSYKYNKIQNNLLLNKVAKNAKALLYINHENFFSNLIESMLEPVDLIKAHLVNEGINESAHRKTLELQLLQKKREINQIEEQLNNMRFMDELNRLNNGNGKESRPNSRLKQPKNSHNKSYQNNNGEGDEIETVKNSMINLLNVVVEQEDNPNDNTSHQNQALANAGTAGAISGNNNGGVAVSSMHQHMRGGMSNPSNRNNLKELSEEAVKQMQLQHLGAFSNNENNFQEMYEEIQSIAQNKKIQIIFKSQSEAGENNETEQRVVIEEEQDHQRRAYTGESVKQSQTPSGLYQGAAGPSGGRRFANELAEVMSPPGQNIVHYEQLCEDDEEERKTLPDRGAIPKMESQKSDPIVIIQSPGNAELNLKQMQSFNSQGQSKILHSGGHGNPYSIVSPKLALSKAQQAAIVHQYVQNVAINESKGMQTSHQRIPSLEKHSIRDAQLSAGNFLFSNVGYSVKLQREFVDQSIQMTFEEPPEEEMLKNNGSSIEPNLEDEGQQQEMERFLSRQVTSRSSDEEEGSEGSPELHTEIVQSTLETQQVQMQQMQAQQTVEEYQQQQDDEEQEDDDEEEDEDDGVNKECSQQVPFLSPIQQQQPQQHIVQMLQQQNNATIESSGSNTAKQEQCLTSPAQATNASAQMHNQSQYSQQSQAVVVEQELERMKIKYQKQLMQEYSSFVEKMSKDVFDANFLKNFQLFGGVGGTGEVENGALVNNPAFQSPFGGHGISPQPNQVQVQNPKVHNLNISIHNNANYASPFPIDQIPTGPFAPVQHFSTALPTPSHQQQPQYNSTSAQQYLTQNPTMKIPLKQGGNMPSSSGGIGGSSGNLHPGGGVKSPATTAATPVNTSQVKQTPKQVQGNRNAVTQNG